MDNSDTPTLARGLLLNAEPFGFGPTAAIADFFPYLRKGCGRLGYIGTGHTLDLQRRLPYDALQDVSGKSDDEVRAALQSLRASYDVVLTALDFAFAELALQAGFSVCIYDPLTWYWPSIHRVVRRVTYIAQDFFGVKERLAAEAEKFCAPSVVAPIIPATCAWEGERKHVLLNLGGLANPYWSAEDTLSYARIMVEAFVAATAGQPTVIAANSALAKEFAQYGARNFSREEMQDVLRTAQYAFMTPGLGNIYDAARYATPTIWLPPANDSQGQQRDLLRAHARLDGALDWHDFLNDAVIDYGADQPSVLSSIGQAVKRASADGASQRRFAAHIARHCDEVKQQTTSRCALLLNDFGTGGAQQVANLVVRHGKEGLHAHL